MNEPLHAPEGRLRRRVTSVLTRRVPLVLTVFVVIGLLLRLPVLTTGIGRDEWVTQFEARAPSIAEALDRVTRLESNPPGFMLIVRAWLSLVEPARLPAPSDLLLEIPSLILGLLLIPVVYGLGRSLVSPATGLLAAAIVVLAPVAVAFSSEARPYSAAAVLCAVTVLLHEVGWVRRRWLVWCGFVVSGAAFCYIQYTGLLVLGALGLVSGARLLATGRSGPWRLVVPAFAATALLFVPALPGFLQQVAVGVPYETTVPVFQRPLLFLNNLAYPLPLPASQLRRGVLYVFAALGFVLAVRRVVGDRLALRVPAGQLMFSPLAAMTAVIVLVAAVEAAWSLGERHMFATVPLAWCVMAYAVLSLRRAQWPLPVPARVRDPFIGVTALVVIILAVAYAAYLGIQPKSGTRDAARELRLMAAAAPSVIRVVATPDFLALTVDYYVEDAPLTVDAFPPISFESGRDFAETDDVWFQADVAEYLDRLLGIVNESNELLVVVYTPGAYVERIAIPYEKAEQLVEAIKGRYDLVRQKQFPGRLDDVILLVFMPRSNG